MTSGVYLLVIKLSEDIAFAEGKYCGKELQKGYYLYSGSAQKNLHHRIKRHLLKNKPLRWHIDFLTSKKEAEVIEYYIFPSAPKNYECEITGKLELTLTRPLKGFGSSDCSKCFSHLLYSERKPGHNHLLALYQSTVRCIASSSE